jgi:hypothetical protein
MVGELPGHFVPRAARAEDPIRSRADVDLGRVKRLASYRMKCRAVRAEKLEGIEQDIDIWA